MNKLVWNETQLLISACYEDGSLAQIEPSQLDDCGDGLFTYLMREAEKVTCTSEYLSRLGRAQEQMAYVYAMLEETKWQE